MKTRQGKFTRLTLILIACLFLTAPMALAAEVRCGEIPVEVSVGGSAPTVDEDYKIILKADSPNYPMPVGSSNGRFSMTITGENSAKLPSIVFSSLGTYTYTIFQEAGTNKLGTYDNRVYRLVVYVENAINGSGIVATCILYPQGQSAKIDKVSFHNTYEADEIPSPPDEEPPDPSEEEPPIPPDVEPPKPPEEKPPTTPDGELPKTPEAKPTPEVKPIVTTDDGLPKTGISPLTLATVPLGIALVVSGLVGFIRDKKDRK